MADKKKVYGLIMPKKKPEQTKARPSQSAAFNVFGNDSDEEEKPSAPVSLFSQSAGQSKVKRQTQVEIDNALQEDPNVYEYDAIYDEIQARKPQVGAKEKEMTSEERRPKYIVGLLKAAEQKKKDDEKRKERKVQKEREAEGDMFADKEKFVTSAYKQKMLAMQEEEERERREAAFEALTDVTKQKDMSGFYRYLYRQTTGNEVASASNETTNLKKEDIESPDVKTVPDSIPRQRKKKSPRTSSSSSESSLSNREDLDTEATGSQKKAEFLKSSRPASSSNFRKRRCDSTSSDSDENKERDEEKEPAYIQKQYSRSRSPYRDYSNKERGSITDYKKRRSKSHSHSPVYKRKETDRSRSREHIREGQSSGSKDSGRSKHRSRSREKSRRSREKSRRSRSKDKYRKDQSSKSRLDIRRSPVSKSHTSDRKRKNSSRSSSEGSSQKVQSQRLKGKDASKELERFRNTKTEDREKSFDKQYPKQDEERGKTMSSGSEAPDKLAKKVRNDTRSDVSGGPAVMEGPAKPKPIDPAKKVYPHHNSSEDIAAARKRYLQRKLARARAS